MPAPIKWKSKLLLAKIEVSEGVDPTPTGAANAIRGTNVRLTPMDGEDVSRDLEQPFLGAQEMIPAGLRARIQFNVEIAPSGTAGVAPAWGPLLRACGCAQTIVADTSVTYNPVTDDHESMTLWIWHGRTRQIIKGARGTSRLRFTAQQLPYLEFDFIGTFTEPTEADQVSPTYTGFKKPKVVSETNTTFAIDGEALVLRELSLDLGNQVEPRLLIGREQIIIVDRADTLATRVEAVPLSTLNPFALALGDPIEVELVHGKTAGAIATLNIPTAQMKRPSGFDQAQNVLEWPLELVPLPDAGNDQWTLELT